jgi:fibronectin type 3 domain-containing protein
MKRHRACPRVVRLSRLALALLVGISTGCSLSSKSASAPPPVPLSSPQHSVSLSWNASTSLNVVAYNIYRATVSGGSYGLQNSMNASTTYTDKTVQSGQTYYYVVTAVDSAGAESGYSNQVQAIIPTP